MWYEFRAYNAEVLYGWTQDVRVAEAALERLNAGCEVNLYAMAVVADGVVERLSAKGSLNEPIFDDDTSLLHFGLLP